MREVKTFIRVVRPQPKAHALFGADNKFLLGAKNSNKKQKQLVEILLQRAVFCIFRRRIYTNCTEPAHGVLRLHTYLFVLIFKNFSLF